jgi:hypothetical protein
MREFTAGQRAAAARLVQGLEPQAEPRFGKWSSAGVPHKGWFWIGEEDVGDDLETCEMCESAQVRYVHVMANSRWPLGTLRVGCYCASRMSGDAVGAERREAELKRIARNPEASAAMSWVQAADRILAADVGLSPKEAEFVRQARMEWSARPRAKKHYQLSDRQMAWFKAIYLRVVGRNGGGDASK